MSEASVYYGPLGRYETRDGVSWLTSMLNPITCSSVRLAPAWRVEPDRQAALKAAFDAWCEERWAHGDVDRDPLAADPYRLLGGTDGSG